jgi:hypothetical protein
MVRKIFAVVAVVLLLASVSYAASLFDVIASTVKATTSGVTKVVTNANPGKILSDATEGSVEAGQKAGEATIGTATNTVGVVSQATGN